jgi:hypothetical protein
MAITPFSANTPSSSTGPAPADVPLALWPVGQAAIPHGKSGPAAATVLQDGIPSALARRIIVEYSKVGQLVVDPLARAGASLIEAARLRRRAFGVERNPRSAARVAANLDQSLNQAERPLAQVAAGAPEALAEIVGEHVGTIDLIVVAPQPDLPAAPTADAFYRACFVVLQPAGRLVTVTTNTRYGDRCIDAAGTSVRLAQQVGFTYLQHVIALHTPVRSGVLKPPSAEGHGPTLDRPRRDSKPAHLLVHQDVCVFTKPAVTR